MAQTDHFYDDGYNRVDSSGNFDHLTSYWGYRDASQFDPLGDRGYGTITMNSSQTLIDAGSYSAWQDAAVPGLEVYWLQDLAEYASWTFGLRTALRWQRIALDSRALFRTTMTTISDAYALGGIIPPGAPFDGSWAGPNGLLGDLPTRTESDVAGAAMLAQRSLDANLLSLDLGPSLAVDLSGCLRAVLSAGVTVAWVQSEFSYHDGPWASGSVTDRKWLCGSYAGADLQCRLGAHWGLFGGAVYTRLEDFSQQSHGRSADLLFDHVLTFRTGLFFQ
ncbi:MAG: hypothetical protein ACOYOU_04410 [Kiritimatiellia bacterium]